MSQSLADQLATTALSGGNAGFIEDLYEQFLRDPGGVDPAWRDYFKALAGNGGAFSPRPPPSSLFAPRSQPPPPAPAPGRPSARACAQHGAAARLPLGSANSRHP